MWSDVEELEECVVLLVGVQLPAGVKRNQRRAAARAPANTTASASRSPR